MLADFHSVMPLIPTGGTLAEALTFFIAQLGFAVTRQWQDGAIIQRGNVSFMLVPNSNREWADNASFSIGVTDLDGLYQEYSGRAVPMGPLEMMSWGRREFHMLIPSGVCLQFFQQE